MMETRRGLKAAMPRMSRFALEHLLVLGAALALIWVNVDPESYFRFAHASSFAVNDIAMMFFFGLMAKEVVEATARGGVLNPWRRALLPVVGAFGATVLPALIYIQLVDLLDEPMLALAWPVSLVTDVALGYVVARLIFKKHPAVPFFILLALASDALGFVALALFNPSRPLHLGVGALLLVMAMTLARGLRGARVKSFWPYLLTAGSLSWFALFWSGVHPALALVPIVPFLPHAARDPGFFVDAKLDARDTLSRFEIWWRYPAQVALFFFGLVNAGVPFGALEPGVWGLPLAILVGKPIGLLIAGGVAVAAGLHLPPRVGWRELIVIGLTASIAFSVGLFFSTALLPPGQLRSEVSMGVLLTLFALPLAIAIARALRVGRFGASDVIP
jgi:NhaA family Na+:H+ antiporter